MLSVRRPLIFAFLTALAPAIVASQGAAAGILGDADGDGLVNGNDLIAVQTNFGSDTPSPGDADCDGDVDYDDLLAVVTNDFSTGAGVLGGVTASVRLVDDDHDETFDVYFEATGSAGLAIFHLALDDLSSTPIDPATIVWSPNELGTVDENLNARGFDPTTAGASGGGYSVYGSQWNTPHPVYGIGVEEVDFTGLSPLPDIALGVPALLGELTIPGFYDLSVEEEATLLRANVALFVSESSSGFVGSPASTEVVLSPPPIDDCFSDPDGDGDIDGDDLIAVQTNFGATGPPGGLLTGDYDCDDDVDGDDLIAVQTNFGAVATTAIPEPGTWTLLAPLVFARRRRSRERVVALSDR